MEYRILLFKTEIYRSEFIVPSEHLIGHRSLLSIFHAALLIFAAARLFSPHIAFGARTQIFPAPLTGRPCQLSSFCAFAPGARTIIIKCASKNTLPAEPHATLPKEQKNIPYTYYAANSLCITQASISYTRYYIIACSHNSIIHQPSILHHIISSSNKKEKASPITKILTNQNSNMEILIVSHDNARQGFLRAMVMDFERGLFDLIEILSEEIASITDFTLKQLDDLPTNAADMKWLCRSIKSVITLVTGEVYYSYESPAKIASNFLPGLVQMIDGKLSRLEEEDIEHPSKSFFIRIKTSNDDLGAIVKKAYLDFPFPSPKQISDSDEQWDQALANEELEPDLFEDYFQNVANDLSQVETDLQFLRGEMPIPEPVWLAQDENDDQDFESKIHSLTDSILLQEKPDESFTDAANLNPQLAIIADSERVADPSESGWMPVYDFTGYTAEQYAECSKAMDELDQAVNKSDNSEKSDLETENQ